MFFLHQLSQFPHQTTCTFVSKSNTIHLKRFFAMQTNFTTNPLGSTFFPKVYQCLFGRPPAHLPSIIVVDVVSSRSPRTL